MFNDHERFNNLLSGLKNLVLSISIIIGGIWTIITFNVLNKVNKARIELTELEKKLEEQAQIEINNEASRISFCFSLSLASMLCL